jgi:hypothetical protein
MNAPTESWLPVVGWEDHYEVSNHGRVRRIKAGKGTRYMRASFGNAATTGYLQTTLTRDGKCHREYMHRLVCEAFLPNPEGKPYVNHIDGNKYNNRHSNLEWVTPRENLLHRSRVLGLEVGEKHHAAKFTRSDVLEIRKAISAGRTNSEIAPAFNASSKNINHIRNRTTWAHLA